ncbi:hypothetical protein FraQA3DRAFT_6244 [Frankia sp. QA3]|nr:hypothetical protein FraQA3DRAFT_6244 [Frankia sp. QA3]
MIPDRWKYAIWAVIFAVALAATGCADGGLPEPAASPGDHVTVEATSSEATSSEAASGEAASSTGVTVIECGRPFRPPAGGRLILRGRFPAEAEAADRAVAGTVEVTSGVALHGVGAPRADVFLVRDGRVATLPVPQDALGVRWDLAPGKITRLSGEATLVACDPAGGLVRPGGYDLYARVLFTPDDGAGVESFGGPWPLDVR